MYPKFIEISVYFPKHPMQQPHEITLLSMLKDSTRKVPRVSFVLAINNLISLILSCQSYHYSCMKIFLPPSWQPCTSDRCCRSSVAMPTLPPSSAGSSEPHIMETTVKTTVVFSPGAAHLPSPQCSQPSQVMAASLPISCAYHENCGTISSDTSPSAGWTLIVLQLSDRSELMTTCTG